MGKNKKNFIPPGHIHLKENVLTKDNISGVLESKALWAKHLNLVESAEYTFFAACGYQHMKYVAGMMKALDHVSKIGLSVGKVIGLSNVASKAGLDMPGITAKLMASDNDSYTPVLTSLISVLRKLDVDVGYLGKEEPCCGSPLYYAGFEKEYITLANNNYQLFKSKGVKKILGIVPACTSALKNIYPKYIEGYDLDVKHVIEIIAERIRKKALRPKTKKSLKVTYHDPCQLSRYMGIVNEPREIINAIEGIKLIEPDFEKYGRWSTCCGGGGLEATHPEISHRLGEKRIDELIKTGADVILSNCPACEMQLKNAAIKQDSRIEVINLIKFLDDTLE